MTQLALTTPETQPAHKEGVRYSPYYIKAGKFAIFIMRDVDEGGSIAHDIICHLPFNGVNENGTVRDELIVTMDASKIVYWLNNGDQLAEQALTITRIINSAGLHNLSKGVRIDAPGWFLKARLAIQDLESWLRKAGVK